MSNHLSAAQIAEWASGEWSDEWETHLRACPECRLQVEEFQAVLNRFRGAVRQWSEVRQQPGRPNAWRAERTTPQMPGVYWAAAMAALCALAAIFVFHEGALSPALSERAHSPVTDAALMRQVDTEVSQTVPDAMEPLMKLVSWDGAPPAEEPSSNASSAKKEE